MDLPIYSHDGHIRGQRSVFRITSFAVCSLQPHPKSKKRNRKNVDPGSGDVKSHYHLPSFTLSQCPLPGLRLHLIWLVVLPIHLECHLGQKDNMAQTETAWMTVDQATIDRFPFCGWMGPPASSPTFPSCTSHCWLAGWLGRVLACSANQLITE